MDNLTLRPATVADAEICYRIKQQTLKTYVDKILGWDEIEQREIHKKSFTPAETTIICYNNTPIGYCELEETEDNFFLKNILLRKKYQKTGIGSFVLGELIENAEAKQKSITLQVFKTNTKAQKLYHKLGFKIYGTEEHHFRMLREF